MSREEMMPSFQFNHLCRVCDEYDVVLYISYSGCQNFNRCLPLTEERVSVPHSCTSTSSQSQLRTLVIVMSKGTTNTE